MGGHRGGAMVLGMGPCTPYPHSQGVSVLGDTRTDPGLTGDGHLLREPQALSGIIYLFNGLTTSQRGTRHPAGSVPTDILFNYLIPLRCLILIPTYKFMSLGNIRPGDSWGCGAL